MYSKFYTAGNVYPITPRGDASGRGLPHLPVATDWMNRDRLSYLYRPVILNMKILGQKLPNRHRYVRAARVPKLDLSLGEFNPFKITLPAKLSRIGAGSIPMHGAIRKHPLADSV